jgi:hypothetical protein
MYTFQKESLTAESSTESLMRAESEKSQSRTRAGKTKRRPLLLEGCPAKVSVSNKNRVELLQ